jgi:hypothetical protein
MQNLQPDDVQKAVENKGKDRSAILIVVFVLIVVGSCEHE